MKDRDTPLRLVRKWERMIPGIYTELDHLQAAKTEGEMSWPDYCDLPISAAYTYLVFHEGLSNQTAAMVAAELTACWTWRRTKKYTLSTLSWPDHWLIRQKMQRIPMFFRRIC